MMKTIEEIVEDIDDQDNLGTANPIYYVKEKRSKVDQWDNLIEWDEVVQPFFSKKEAERYIRSNSHNLNEPFIWVGTAYRNREWIAIQKFLEDQIPEPRVPNEMPEWMQRQIDLVNKKVASWPIAKQIGFAGVDPEKE